MDLYRYFHPHHNPRLRSVALRLQELGELEQAALELRKAVKRAEVRAENSLEESMQKAAFAEVHTALDYVVNTLSKISEAHPGDGLETMCKLLEERKNAPGWENWSRLLNQRLKMIPQSEYG